MAPLPPQPGVMGGDDMVDKVEELSSPHEAGVLTDEEFAAAKAKLFS